MDKMHNSVMLHALNNLHFITMIVYIDICISWQAYENLYHNIPYTSKPETFHSFHNFYLISNLSHKLFKAPLRSMALSIGKISIHAHTQTLYKHATKSFPMNQHFAL